MFNIGDRVVTVYGEECTIIDRFFSEKDKKYYYSIETGSIVENFVPEEKLRAMPKENYNITAEMKVVDNVVIGIVYKDGIEVCRGHGHIIHEGEKGIVQTISYAYKKAYEKLNGGQV